MILKDVIWGMIIYGIGNLIVWFQLNGQFKWDFWKDNIVLVGLMGIPISVAFFYATKLSYTGFDGMLWPGRLVAFGVSMMSFTFCTWYFLGEGLSTKTLASLLIATGLVCIQVFWK